MSIKGSIYLQEAEKETLCKVAGEIFACDSTADCQWQIPAIQWQNHSQHLSNPPEEDYTGGDFGGAVLLRNERDRIYA